MLKLTFFFAECLHPISRNDRQYIYDRLASFRNDCANRSDLPTRPHIETNFWTSALIGCQGIRLWTNHISPHRYHCAFDFRARIYFIAHFCENFLFFDSSFSLYKYTPLKTFTYLQVLQTCTSLLCGILHLTFNRLDSLVLLLVVILNFCKGVNMF